MLRPHRQNRRGQALLLCMFSLMVLLGVLALAVDLGWARYVSRRAQSAADSAALAAAAEALRNVGADGLLECGEVGCQSATPCPSSNNLDTGCSYAAANGFTEGGDAGRQSVEMAAGVNGTAPGVPDVPVEYWVQATTAHRLPQLFASVVSSMELTPAARATAAVRQIDFTPSIHLLNRRSDCFVSAAGLGLVCGEDFLGIGWNYVKSPGGIYMSSSNPSGLGLPNIAAGTVLGNVEIDSPFTYLMGDGGFAPLLGLGSVNWTDAPPTNGFPDGDYFTDPMAGKPQPPAPTGLPDHPVVGGIILGPLFGAPKVLPPGHYYSTTPGGLLGADPTATGTPITVVGKVVFSDGATPPCGGFCEYVFHGGLVTGALSSVTFSPGRYVIAGAQPVAGGPGVGLTVGANAVMKDLTPLVNGKIEANTDAGEIFIFTDSNYPGLTLPADLQSAGISLPHAQAGLVAGLGANITLHGLNKSNGALPSELDPYAPVLFWQDRTNTTLKYTATGFLDRTCGGICNNLLSVPGSQEFVLQATQKPSGGAGTNLYGTIYGPRGTWLTILGILPGDTVAGPLQVITGALQMTLNSRLDLELLPTPPQRSIVGLID